MIDKTFLTAGKAIFTVSNPKGDRYTFRISKPERDFNGSYFAAVLTGSDNENDYSYIGMVSERQLRYGRPETFFQLRATKASKFREDALPFKVLVFALSVIGTSGTQRPLPAGYEINHAGKCGRCARTLTVPESILSGIGPECASKMGIDQKAAAAAVRASQKALPLGGPTFEMPTAQEPGQHEAAEP